MSRAERPPHPVLMRTSMLVLALMLFPLSAAAQLAPPRTALPPPLPAPWASGAKPPTLTLPGFGAPTATPGYPFPQPLLSPAAPRWGIPVGHHREPAPDRRRWELIAPGIVALVGGYVGWVLTTIMWNSVNNTCNGSTWGLFPSCWFDGRGPDGSDIGRSFLPLVGPWWSIASSQTMRGADLFVPVLAGVGQLAGLVMLIVGLATPVSLAVAEPSIGSVRIDVDASPESAMARLSVALP